MKRPWSNVATIPFAAIMTGCFVLACCPTPKLSSMTRVELGVVHFLPWKNLKGVNGSRVWDFNDAWVFRPWQSAWVDSTDWQCSGSSSDHAGARLLEFFGAELCPTRQLQHPISDRLCNVCLRVANHQLHYLHQCPLSSNLVDLPFNNGLLVHYGSI